MKRLVLIDGNGILYRAYHALPPLTTPDGTLVGAVYGFTSMLIKIFQDFQPTHLAVAFDRPEPTFRKELFKDYQAQRPETPEGMVSQIDKVREVISAFDIPIYEAAGFEADDVLATIATNADSQVVIVTGDRDLLQLVSDRVKVFMPTKGLSEGKLYGVSDVISKMGVPPSQIPDLKALMGDPSDNYPGVSGIGPKTAIKLLNEFGSVKRLLKAKKIDEARARLGLELATIRTDVPIAFSLSEARIKTLDTLSARTKLADFHFPSLVKRLGGKEGSEGKEGKVKKPEKKPEEKKEQLSLV